MGEQCIPLCIPLSLVLLKKLHNNLRIDMHRELTSYFCSCIGSYMLVYIYIHTYHMCSSFAFIFPHLLSLPLATSLPSFFQRVVLPIILSANGYLEARVHQHVEIMCGRSLPSVPFTCSILNPRSNPSVR